MGESLKMVLAVSLYQRRDKRRNKGLRDELIYKGNEGDQKTSHCVEPTRLMKKIS